MKEKYLIIFCLFAGSLLRLVWPADMIWLSDEIWMYENSQKIANGAVELPSLGMLSGAGIYNPSMSVWVFSLISVFAKTPVGVVQWIQWMNIIAIWIFYFFISRNFLGLEKEVWLKGTALWAVSSLPILLSRKIWAQDILPFIACLLFLCHWKREKRIFSFLWGFLGVIIGQIHMSGFFFSFALIFWSLMQDIRHKKWDLKTGFFGLPVVL